VSDTAILNDGSLRLALSSDTAIIPPHAHTILSEVISALEKLPAEAAAVALKITSFENSVEGGIVLSFVTSSLVSRGYTVASLTNLSGIILAALKFIALL
jgi:hypothetical protein